MLNFSWLEWVGITLVFYTYLTLSTDFLGKKFYPHLLIGGSTRRKPAIPKSKVAAYFIVNTVIVGTLIYLAFLATTKGYGHLYHQEITSAWSVAIIFGQFLLVYFVRDANFYLFHRILHSNKKLYKYLHRHHHEARFPNVWHLQYQHPLELLIMSAAPIFWVVLLPVPLSIEAYLLALAVSITADISGHSGYEMSGTPLRVFALNGWIFFLDPKRKWIARLFSNNLHHDLHHQRFSSNFGLYFTWWDYIFKSIDKDTDNMEKFITERKKTSAET